MMENVLKMLTITRPSIARRTGNGFKSLVSRVVLFVLYRALKVLARDDRRVASEVATWQEGQSVAIEASLEGPSICFKKESGRIVRCKDHTPVDIRITFRSLDAAFLVLTGQMDVANAYAQHRFMLNGDINKAMSLVRCIDIAESYLFPHIMTKRILKRVESKEFSALRVYRKVFLGV